MVDLFDMFETSSDLENDGVWLNFGVSKALVARSDASNTAWFKELNKEVKKAGKATWDAVDLEEKVEIYNRIFCKTAIKDHKIQNEDGEWVSGIPLKENGEKVVVEFSPENMLKCFKQLPEYYKKIQDFAGDYKTFRASQIEEQEKNS